MSNSEITQRQDQDGNDRPVQLAPRHLVRRPGTVDFGFAPDALRRDLESPGEQDHQRKSEGQNQHKTLHDPTRGADIIQNKVRYLQHQPAGHGIADGDAENVTLPEFVE